LTFATALLLARGIFKSLFKMYHCFYEGQDIL